VKGGNDQPFSAFAPHLLYNALAHFPRGLVGKGESDNGLGRGGMQQPGYAHSDDPGFARPGSGKNQHRAMGVFYRLLLGLIEV
jgi:hypothetical protein